MSVSPLPTAPLSPYLTERPGDVAENAKIRSIACNVLSKISVVAFVAITAVVLSVSLGLLVVAPHTLILLIIPALFLLPLGKMFYAKAISYEKTYEQEKIVQEELDQIASWTDTQIRDFLHDHELSKNDIKESRELLPLIARFRALSDQKNSTFKEAEELLHPATSLSLEQKYRSWAIGWHTLETQAIPFLLNCALMLEIIQHPQRQERSIHDLGTLHMRPLALRTVARVFAENDAYLEIGRRFISLEEIRNLRDNLTSLRAKLFSANEEGIV